MKAKQIKYVRARGCRCMEPREFVHNECHRCGRTIRVEVFVRTLKAYEGLWMMEGAIQRARWQLNQEVREQSGCDSYRELLEETYWARDFMRLGKLPV